MGIDCGTSAVCNVVLEYVVPSVGCVTTAAIFLAPWAGVTQVARRKGLGELNPVPFAWMCCNSLGWVVYGQKVQNYFVAIPNVVGYLFGIHYFLSTYPFASIRQRKFLYLILFLGSAVIFSMAVVANVTLADDLDTSRLTLGYTAVAILIVFYSSPLSTLYKVIKQKDASSLGPALAIASAVNGGFWAIYGFAIGDAFISIPNAIGAVVGVIQLVLIAIFGRNSINRSPIRAADDEEDRETVSNSNTELPVTLYALGKGVDEVGNVSKFENSVAVHQSIFSVMESGTETVVVENRKSSMEEGVMDSSPSGKSVS